MKTRKNKLESIKIGYLQPEQTEQTKAPVIAEDKNRTRLMDKYSIVYENNRYVWGSQSFDTLNDAIKFAESFVEKISVDDHPLIENF